MVLMALGCCISLKMKEEHVYFFQIRSFLGTCFGWWLDPCRLKKQMIPVHNYDIGIDPQGSNYEVNLKVLIKMHHICKWFTEKSKVYYGYKMF